MDHMADRQELELKKIEHQQRIQFSEFTEGWDQYMDDYDTAAHESLKKM